MKKILLSLFGIITLGIINFSSAGSYTYTGNYYSSSSSYCAGSYKLFSISIPNIIGYNPDLGSTKLTSAVCGIKNLTSGLVINSVSLTGPTGSGPTMSSSSCPSGFDGYTCYSGVANASQLFNISWSGTSGLSGGCGFDYFCVFSGDNIINQSDLGGSSNCSQCESDLATCQSNFSGVNLSLSICQSDLLTCQNSSSSCSPSGQCSVSDKVEGNLLFTGSKSFSNAGYTNMFNYGTEGAGTYCIKFTSTNAQTLTMGFANGGTTAPTNLYSLYNDQYGNWICLYGNKPYLNVKLNAGSNTINYEVYKLTDLLSDSIPCSESSGESCDYSEYESQISTLSGNLATCEGLYDRLEADYDLLSGNYNTCTSELSSCLQNGGSSGSGEIQRSSLFINNIQHLGNENIFITIPEYLKFSYTNTGDDFELDIVGLEQDEEYLSGVINKQNYIPTTEDFSNVFSNFGLFGGLLVVCLFVIFVFYIIKKIFS